MTLITDLVIMAAALVAAMIDLRSRKIPNWLTLTVAAAGMFGGFLFYAIQGDWTGGWQWLLFSGKGWLVGIGLFLIPFMLGGMGGGDVKLLGAIGAFKGVGFVIETALFGALWGGVLALLAILLSKKTGILKRFGFGLKLFAKTGGQAGKDFMLPAENVSEKEKLYVPYGVAIFLGVLTVYFAGVKLPL